MSLITLEVPKEYGYVLAVATGTLFLGAWHGGRVMPFRKAAGVPYPYQYASKEQIDACDDAKQKSALQVYNCAQRAHYNYIENHPTFLTAMLISGLRYPVAAASVGAAWCLGRTLYAIGYTRPNTENGKGRLIGVWASLLQIGMLGTAAWTCWKLCA
ncbi:uncharacterized protein K452DRAFT_290821 [Aplosporella prunicola CBS 121167]|uniref:Membrane-associated proteins in eicosanoid and glutathione metabolism n=1 Tax=Aplosporella prunicola CBS 121167 TaxID=1176127 RepID=A0A6A6B231_9PEZI|nr:uncharacterized protein K452DRAFT_290821 [Aplosporella prunicola CBS 121167]KAF2138239.1 hypothetical protein K452DRAFT_290821 [Aplosporella prunicola CBS 121167]